MLHDVCHCPQAAALVKNVTHILAHFQYIQHKRERQNTLFTCALHAGYILKRFQLEI